jgi:hypothetical protein
MLVQNGFNFICRCVSAQFASVARDPSFNLITTAS